MILVPVIPFIVILGIGYYYFKGSIENSTIATMRRIVQDHGQMIDSFLSERKANLQFIHHSFGFEVISNAENLEHIFTQLQKESNAFVDLGVFNKEGLHIAYMGPYKLVGRDYGGEAWFKEVMKQGYYISDVYLGYRRIPHFIIALKREDGGKTWVIRATIDTYMFNDLVKRVRIGKTGEAYILNEKGVLQTERRSGGNIMESDLDNIDYYPKQEEGISTFIGKDVKGIEYLSAITWLNEKKWLLVVRQEKADAFKALRAATYLIVLVLVIGGGAIIGVALYLTDRIVRRMEGMDTEKEQLSDQLVRASRLAELGEMAAGFAHEINNPLQVIRSEQALIETILSDLKEKGELKESEDLAEVEDSIDQIKLQIDRCARITQAILKFGRQGEPVYKELDLGGFIPQVIEMVATKAAVHGITLKEEISEDTPKIHGDAGQLQQVLLNLFNNAIDAILERHGTQGGELVVGAGPKEDGKVRVMVRDNGCGINPENLKKVFAPFFTTKPVGKGTGLGLSVCYGIIDRMGGVMEVSSEKGVGTTFTISLPAAA